MKVSVHSFSATALSMARAGGSQDPPGVLGGTVEIHATSRVEGNRRDQYGQGRDMASITNNSRGNSSEDSASSSSWVSCLLCGLSPSFCTNSNALRDIHTLELKVLSSSGMSPIM